MDMKTSPLATLTDPGLLKTDALIGGEWVAAGAAGASRFDITDPATGLKLADVANLGPIDCHNAIGAALLGGLGAPGAECLVGGDDGVVAIDRSEIGHVRQFQAGSGVGDIESAGASHAGGDPFTTDQRVGLEQARVGEGGQW